ncbi:unnamed protein product [Brachionus calyciflorus]|uniref:BZIP domain-containing protein n=1 Tax=Brachionus calyciflorus TaxID=104777 RepID=A0A813N4C3_9BILA|nr:unnamed protein product [Brachionus calyciflorus]
MFNPSAQKSVNLSGSSESKDTRFPTDGLKSLLKNSELLEMLLKPLGSGKSDENISVDTNNNSNDLLNTQLDLDFPLAEIDKSKSLFDWENSEEYLEIKAAKSNSDGDNSKIYGNAFLGQNLWDKNDLFQSEKFGVKFECLEIDEFLNENGLNETDVEFLDQLHKFENSSTNQSSNNTNNNQSSSSSLSPKSSCISTPSSSPSINLDSNLMSGNMSMLHSNSSTSASSISSSSPSSNNQVSRANMNAQNVQFQNGNLKNKQDVFDERKSSSRNSFDWSLSMNDSSMDSVSDYEDYSKAKKFNEDEMKTQPVSRKSKKFVPNELKDEKYWARRRKNNVAAKRSRDARRMKENQIALRASYLERENDLLRKQLEDFKRETKLLKTKLSRYESDVQIENPIK